MIHLLRALGVIVHAWKRGAGRRVIVPHASSRSRSRPPARPPAPRFCPTDAFVGELSPRLPKATKPLKLHEQTERGEALRDVPDLYKKKVGWAASMATETGPTLATASFRAVSLPYGSSTYVEQVAARAEALYRHVPFWWEQGGVEESTRSSSSLWGTCFLPALSQPVRSRSPLLCDHRFSSPRAAAEPGRRRGGTSHPRTESSQTAAELSACFLESFDVDTSTTSPAKPARLPRPSLAGPRV